MAIIGSVEPRRGQQVLLATFTGLVSGEATDRVLIGAWPELVTAYFIFPADLTAGMAQLVAAHDGTYGGDWDLFGPEPSNVIANCVRTVQVPGNGLEFLGVRVTTTIVTSPVGGTLSVVIVGN